MMSKKEKINLNNKIDVIEDYLERTAPDRMKSIHKAHLHNYRTVKKPDKRHIEELKILFQSMLEWTQSNYKRRETEMHAFKDAIHIIK